MTELLKIPKNIRRRFGIKEWLRYLQINQDQTTAETELKDKGVNFRGTAVESIKLNYGKMSHKEFENINSRQQWVNWILIGKCLHKQVPNKPLNILDIGCGTGTSTTVLARYLPPKSHIIANDLIPSLIEVAREKDYLCAHDQQLVVLASI